MDLLEGIYTRRSVRQFTDEAVKKDQLLKIISAGTWAPSGLNNQPWRFATVVDKDTRLEIAGLTKYRKVIKGAQALIVVFVDKDAMYHDVKDHQSIGACIQNMLLAAHALGLGAVWLGEILKSADEVRTLLELRDNLDLMAVIALGHPANRDQKSNRKDIEEVILKEK
jgi:nitroreductase